MGARILHLARFLAVAAALVCTALPAMAQGRAELPKAVETLDGQVQAGDLVFDSWSEYFQSDFFRANGMRCGTAFPANGAPERGTTADCTYYYTNPSGEYDPSVAQYRIPVVVHVIQNTSGSGYISEAMVQSQIEILNEDYLALAGTPGQNGTDVQIEFFLATEDPSGNPTNGITYSTNTTWFNDGGGYYNTLAWNTHYYLNIYTNTAGGYLGYSYVPQQGGIVGSNVDRVVIHYQSFGRNSPGYPYHMGRTATHEVGHNQGLFHTFDPQGSCPSPSGCYSNGDKICDTEPEQSYRFNCSGSSCSTPDPFRNYMDYTNDTCMTNFTPEQARRLRCTLENWRPNLYELVTSACLASGARSCKDHGPAGVLCLDVGLANGIEPRSNGVSELRIDVDDSTVFAGGVTVSCVNAGDVSDRVAGVTFGRNTVTVTFNPTLPNGDPCTVTLDCEASVCVRGLEGDIDGDGTVATTDASIIKPSYGITPDDASCQYDYDTSGTVATTDASLIKPLYGQTAPSCP